MSQIEQYFESNPCGCPSIGIGYQGLIDVSIHIELNIQLLVDDIIYIGAQLEVNIAIGNGIYLLQFTLNGLVVGNAHVEAESNVILYGNNSSFVFPWQFQIVFGIAKFNGPIFTIQFRYLGIRNTEGKITFGFIFESCGQFTFCSQVDANQGGKSFGYDRLTDDVNWNQFAGLIGYGGKGVVILVLQRNT